MDVWFMSPEGLYPLSRVSRESRKQAGLDPVFLIGIKHHMCLRPFVSWQAFHRFDRWPRINVAAMVDSP